MAGISAFRSAVPRTLHGSILCVLWMVKACTANCYLPNGTDANTAAGSANLEDYAPCDAGAAVSMCCAIGSERVAQGDADTCVAGNRLCLSSNKITYWRESCTDPTWTDPACIHLYTSGNTDTTLTNCSDGSWCTGGGYSADGNQTCCEVHDGYFIYPDGSLSHTNPNSTSSSIITSSASSTTLSTSATTPMSTTSSSPTLSSTTVQAVTTTSSTPKPAASSSGLSTGAKTGLGVGIGVGLAASLGLIATYFLLRRRRRNRETRSAPPHEPKETLITEMQGTPVYAEMDHSPSYSLGIKRKNFREVATEPVQLE